MPYAAQLARFTLGIPMLTDDIPREIDLTIDGADEVTPELDLIKGGGGALLREKVVAQASHREVIVVDAGKLNAVQQAKSGYPGAPMDMSDIATVLFKDFMQFDAADPHWYD